MLPNRLDVCGTWLLGAAMLCLLKYTRTQRWLAVWLARLLLATLVSASATPAIVLVGGVLVTQAVAHRQAARAVLRFLTVALALAACPLAQLALLQALDHVYMANQCASPKHPAGSPAGVVEGVVEARMGPLCASIAHHLTPMSRNLNVSYCNLELARHTLFTPATIAAMEADHAYADLAQRASSLPRDMHMRCPVRAESSVASDAREDLGRGVQLTRMAMNMVDAQHRYLRVRVVAVRAGAQSLRLFRALQSLPAEPGFWDRDRILPTDHQPTFLLHHPAHLYLAHLRPALAAHGALPSPFRWAESFVATFLQHPGYTEARAALDALLDAHRAYFSAVNAYHDRRCNCTATTRRRPSPAAAFLTDCSLAADLHTYRTQRLTPSPPHFFLPLDRPPLDQIFHLRAARPFCVDSRAAVDAVRPSASNVQQLSVWRRARCGVLRPIDARAVSARWRLWWDVLGVTPAAVTEEESAAWWDW